MSDAESLLAAPPVRLQVDGGALPPSLAREVLSVEVAQCDRRPAQARIAWRWGEDLDRLLTVGTSVTVAVGTGMPAPALFDGVVTSSERSWQRDGLTVLHVVAHDRLHLLRQRRENTAFERLTASEIVERVAGEHGLEVQRHVRVAERPHRFVTQHGESDLALLHRLAVDTDALLVMRGVTLQYAVPAWIGDPVRLHARHDLHELRVVRREQTPTASVQSWDPADGAAHSTGDGTASAGWWLERDEATALAAGLAMRAEAAQLTLSGEANGDARLRPGTRVRIDGVTDEPVGVVRSTLHRFDTRSGYVTRFDTAPADAPRAAPPAAVTLGTVVDVADPEGRGRVRVTFDVFAGGASAWLPVVSSSAGPGRGAVLLPDHGDRVVVLGPQGDLGRGLVLGGLWGSDHPPIDPIVGGRTDRFGLRLPNGMSLVFDADDATVLLDDGAGSRLVLGPEQVSLFSAVDIDIAAPGRTMTLRADRIAMERA